MYNSTTSNSTFTQNYRTTKSIGNPTTNAYYTISYNGNGGSTPSSTKAYRPFSSWSLSGGGTFSNGTYTFGTQNGTLTANYNSTSDSTTLASSSKSYTITYNTNNSGCTSSKNNQSANVSNQGWYNALSGGKKIASFGGNATFTGNTTLYARWNSSSDSQTLATISKTGYTCKWNTKADGSGNSYNSGATGYTTTGNIILYAIATANSYTLTVNPNGGVYNSTTSNSTFTQNYRTTKSIGNPTTNAYYTISYNGNGGSTPSSTKAYRPFSSWSLSGGGTFSNGTYTFGTQNGTLTANYNSTSNSTTLASSSKSYTITYNTNSTSATSSTSTQSANVSGLGWYDAASAGNKIADFGGSATFTVNKTLYAHWNSESNTMTLATISKNGSACKWNTKTDGSGTTYSSGQTNVKFSASTTLYAICTVNKYTNTLNYNANGGSGAPSSQTASVTYPNTQSEFTVSGTKPTRTGYTFNGWYTAASGGSKVGATYTVGSKNQAKNQSATLYAQWTENTLRIQYSKGTATLNTNNSNISYNSDNIITSNGQILLINKKYSQRTEKFGLANVTNKNYIYLEYGDHKAISGKEWCTETAGGGKCYNHDKDDYNATNFCDLASGSCNITLRVNWNAIITSSKTSSYKMPSVCTKAGVTSQNYQFFFKMHVDDSPASGKICTASSSNGSGQQGCYNYTKDEVGKCKNTGYGGAYFENTHTTTSKSWYYYRSTSYVYAYVKTTHGKTASKTQG